jgi:hypothetical protein
MLKLRSTTLLPVLEVTRIVCSPCHSRGLHCTFGQPLQTKFRHGKRIAHIQRSQLEGESLPSKDSDNPPPSPTLIAISTPLPAASDLLGVPGLTRTLLEACIRAYFSEVQPCRPVLHPEDFFNSYEAFWQPLHLQKVTACHIALLIAVACLGAGQLSAPVSLPGSVA